MVSVSFGSQIIILLNGGPSAKPVRRSLAFQLLTFAATAGALAGGGGAAGALTAGAGAAFARAAGSAVAVAVIQATAAIAALASAIGPRPRFGRRAA